MRLLLSEHAKRRMFERGIELDEIKDVLARGEKWRVRDKFHARMHGIEVVYQVSDRDLFIITVYYK